LPHIRSKRAHHRTALSSLTWIGRSSPVTISTVAVGGWLDDYSTELTRKQTAELIEEAIKADAPAGSDTRKIADFYRSFMDETAIEAKGVAPLRPHLDAIAAIRDKHDLARALGETLRSDVDPLNVGVFHTANLFGLWVAPGFYDPEHYTPYLLQGDWLCLTANTTFPIARKCTTSAASIRDTSRPS
jgi:Peptidase family M13